LNLTTKSEGKAFIMNFVKKVVHGLNK